MIMLLFVLAHLVLWIGLTINVISNFYLAVTNPRIHKRLNNPSLIALWILETIISVMMMILILKY